MKLPTAARLLFLARFHVRLSYSLLSALGAADDLKCVDRERVSSQLNQSPSIIVIDGPSIIVLTLN